MTTTRRKPLFSLGTCVLTAHAARVLDPAAVNDALARHAVGDWGDVVPADAAENDLALREGFRLLSAYGRGERRFWVITEADRSATTVLLPEEY